MIQGVVINASFPRSGHRYLRRILAGYFGNEFVFFEPYTQSLSDERFSGGSAINYVKTHDFDLQGPAVLEDLFPVNRRYLVQLRHPLSSIASYYEFTLRHNRLLPDVRLYWEFFLSLKLKYWKDFVSLWLGDDIPGQIVLYEDLTANPIQVCENVIEWLAGEAVSKPGLVKAVDRAGFYQYVGDDKSTKQETRDLVQFKYYDADKFGRIENELLADYLQPLGIPTMIL